MRVAAAEGAAPAERGGDAGAGWRELRGGARGAEPKTAPAPGAGAAGARRGVASSWSGVGGRGGCGERLAGERAGWRQRTGIGNGGWVRGASEPCVEEAAAAVRTGRRRKPADRGGRRRQRDRVRELGRGRQCVRVRLSPLSSCHQQPSRAGESGWAPVLPAASTSGPRGSRGPRSRLAPCVLPATSWLPFTRSSSELVLHAAGRISPRSCRRSRASPHPSVTAHF